MDTVCGGASKTQVATPEIQQLCDKVKHDALKQAGVTFKMFVAKSFISQVVAGTNYFIKAQVGDHDFVHLKVFQSLPCYGHKVELIAIQTKKTLDDTITMF
ncbi:cystatin-B-like [Electrophorus electricus]|uniref:Cystatin-B n=1 Tax=Electrophorus electricus TaxID=8005 RepID=A0A4W4GZ97_ELEEL|nr:cystatin-B-like [Electrophorus electricus]